MAIAASELIINPDGSIYHLNLKPGDIAQTIITVGDPDRVSAVSDHFDHIEFKTSKREFHTHTGTYKGKRLSVISTGIGTDNIDIVFNELDALVNVDFEKRIPKEHHTALNFIRIGTTGSVQTSIPVDAFLLSQRGIGFDGLLHWYENDCGDSAFAKAVQDQLQLSSKLPEPYVIHCSEELAKKFQTIEMLNGNTVTNVGFYGPQGRSIRLNPSQNGLNQAIADFEYEGHKITNLEMETSGMYAMSTLLGHHAVSLNVILANRATGEFSENPKESVGRLIQFTLDRIAMF
jgi:uridine phosphorylase